MKEPMYQRCDKATEAVRNLTEVELFECLRDEGWLVRYQRPDMNDAIDALEKRKLVETKQAVYVELRHDD